MHQEPHNLKDAEESLLLSLRDAIPGQVFSLIGPPAAGRRTLLRHLASSLGNGRTTISLNLPLPELDAASQAVAAVWSSLGTSGPPQSPLSNQSMMAGLSKELGGLSAPSRACPVALVYAPWLRPGEADRPTATRTAESVTDLLTTLATRCVLVLSAGRTWPLARRVLRIAKFAGSPDWIESEFSSAKEDMLELLEAVPQSSRLELRLAFGLLQAGQSASEIRNQLLASLPLESLADSLWGVLRDRRVDPVLRAWQFLAVGRGPIPFRWLEQGLGADTAALPLVRHALTYQEADCVILHEKLRVPALKALLEAGDGLATWKELHSIHADLWSQERDRLLHESQGSKVVTADVQFTYHTVESGGELEAIEKRLWFQEQLCLLGRTLSKRHKRFSDAYRCFVRAHDIDPEDAYAWHYASYNAARLVESDSAEIKLGYTKAVDLDPNQLWYHQRLVRWLLSRGWIQDAHRAWQEALRQTTSFYEPDEPALYVYRNLHWLVAEMALETGALDFAANVLREVPFKILQLDENLANCKRKLEILMLADQSRLVRPFPKAQALGPHRLMDQPELLPGRSPDGSLLGQWYAARVERLEADRLHLLLGVPPAGPDQEIRFLRSEMAQLVYDGLSQDESFGELTEGRYLEIGEYGPDRKGLIRVFRLEVNHPESSPLVASVR